MSDQPPEQQPGQPPQQPPYAAPYPPLGYPVVAPTSSKATTSLILGIVSLIACGLLLGIPAMIVARQAKREIRESHGRLDGDGLATAGFVTGLIGTVWSILGILLVIGVFVFGGVFAHEVATNCTSSEDANGNVTFNCG